MIAQFVFFFFSKEIVTFFHNLAGFRTKKLELTVKKMLS